MQFIRSRSNVDNRMTTEKITNNTQPKVPRKFPNKAYKWTKTSVFYQSHG